MGHSVGVSCGFEALEPRALLTVFTPFDLFGDQMLLYDLSAPAGTYGFGATVVSLGDLNGDGRPEFAVGAPGRAADGQSGPVEGRVFVHSGATGGLLGTLGDGNVGFGRAIAAVGDTNGDDVPDFAVGSPEFGDASGTQGRVWVYSGADTASLYSVTGDGPLGELGRAIVGVRDVDSDGIADIAIGGRIGDEGEVRVVSGATGALIYTFTRGATNPSFGSVLAPIGADRAEFPLLAVGAPDEDTGRVHVFNADGTFEKTVSSSDTTTRRFGAAIATVPVVVAPQTLGPLYRYFLAVLVPPNVASATDPGGRMDVFRVYVDHSTSLIGSRQPNDDEHVGTGIAFDPALGFLDLLTNTAGASRVRITTLLHYGSGGDSWLLQPGGEMAHASILSGAYAGLGDVDGDGAFEFATGSGTPGAGRVTVLRSGPVRSLHGPSFVARDGSDAWRAAEPGVGSYFLVNGHWLSSTLVPALKSTDEVVDMAGLSLIVGFEHTSVGSARGLAFIIRDGVRVRVIDAVTSTQGGAVSLIRLAPVRALADGRIVFTTQDGTSPSSNTAWIMGADGGLLFLWFGFAADANESGTVVGTKIDAGGVPRGVRWDNGVITEIAGMSGAQAISSDGLIAGWAGADRLVVWDGAVLTDMGAINDSIASVIREPGVTFTSTFSVERVTPQRRVMGHLWVSYVSDDGSHGTFDQWFYTDPTTAPTTKIPKLVPAYPVGSTADYGLTDAGVLIGPGEWNARDNGILYTARAGESVSVSPGGDRFSTINEYGIVVTFSLTGSTWSGVVGPFSLTASAATGELVTWIDPVFHETCVMLTGISPHSGLFMVRGMTGSPEIASVNIGGGDTYDGELHGLTLFHSTDGNVHIFGIDGTGKFVLLSRTDRPLAAADAWTVTRISADDLFFQGLSTPNWVSHPVAFVTPWNSFHVAGLDNTGRVQAVWIAPGMRLWSLANLSVISSAPVLVGGITAFTTAWGGINVVGADAAGDLTAIWWAPALGGEWLTSSLSQAAGSAIRLRGETLTSYVTPWGAMNVAGVDENGGVTIFWWTGETNVWTASTVTADLQQVGPPVGRLSAGVTATGATHIGGVAANGHVVDVNWAPGGSWVTDDVTATAV